jgi:hypothetical protein
MSENPRTGLIVLAIAVGMSLGLLGGCSKERPLNGGTERHRVYLSAQDEPAVLFIFDGDADSLIDSLRMPSEWFNIFSVVCDQAKPLFATQSSGMMRMYRGGSVEPLVTADLASVVVGLDSRRDLLISSVGEVNGTIAPLLRIYRLSDMALLYSDTIGLNTQTSLDRGRGLAYGIAYWSEIPGGGVFWTKLCAYDYVNRKLRRFWNILPDSTGTGYGIRRFVIHPDGRRAYLATERADGARLVGYDLEHDRAIFDLPVSGQWGEPTVSPDGRVVYYPDQGFDDDHDPETITYFDATTGSILGVIDLHPYRAIPSVPVRPWEIRLIPGTDKAHVSCWSRGGTLLVIDMGTREVLKAFYFGIDRNRPQIPTWLDVGPAP